MKRVTYLQGIMTISRKVDNTVEPPSFSLCDGTSTHSGVGEEVPKAKVIGVEGRYCGPNAEAEQCNYATILLRSCLNRISEH